MEGTNPPLNEAGKSEWQAGLLAKGIKDVLWMLDLEGKVTYVSPSVTAHTGYYPEELYGMPLEHFLAPESAARAREMLKDQLAQPPEKRLDSIILELQEKTKNGSYIDIEINAAWMNDEAGTPVGFIGITRNITARKRAEQAQREREEKFRAIRTSTADGIVLINGDGFVEYWNPTFEKMFRYSSPGAQEKKTPGDLVPEKFREPFEAAYRAFRETATETAPPRVVELNAIRGDGTEFPIEITFNPILIEGEFWASAIIRNVTDRKRVEEEHALNERRLAALLELNQVSAASIHDLALFAMEEAVKLTGSSIGYIAFANEDETVLTMYAWSKGAMAECAVDNKPLIYPVDTTGLWGEAVRQRRPIITNDYNADNPWKKGIPKGHVAIHRHMNVPIFDGDRIVIVAGVGNKPKDYDEGDVRQLTLLMEGMWRTVTRRRAEEESRKLQDQLAQASKMEAVGRLAGGVAHDFNNLLTTILGYSEMILSQLNEEDPFRIEVEEIHKAGERAAALTQQLLAFSRRQVIKPRIVDLNEAVKNARKMLERLLGNYINLDFDLKSDIGRVKVDPHQIDQVLLNLAVNARDAMPNGGTLTIATSEATVDKANVHALPDTAAGTYVVLSVADTGVGMNEETKARLFEPFFSTKEDSKGAGLGLAMVYGIAKQNGGAVSVSSTLGAGTVFRIYLPRTSEKPVASVIPLRIASPTGNETVLLVEDDEMVRRLSQRVLTHLGYEVLQACDIEDAIRICEEHPSPIHLLLTDVIMPEMNGVELFTRLKTKRTAMKALFMSGYAEDVVVHQGVIPEGTEFIQKPFNMEDLANRVRQVLDGFGSMPQGPRRG
jgi:PAS domain S-box-containing protein